MKTGVFAAFLIAGIVLTIIGISASNALSSDISRLFTGSPTDKAVWFLVAGLASAIIGLSGLRRGSWS